MNLRQWLAVFRDNPEKAKNIAYWHVSDSRAADFKPFPDWLDERIATALKKRQIWQLYSHQRQAVDIVHEGHNVTVVTPTASGKTLCYNLPVMDAVVKDPTARALYIFPTKALAADQVSELYELVEAAGVDVKTFTYDGDTPPAARKAVRQAGQIVVTNPDMLHSGIMPHHTKWVKLFENLRFIVIDEVHTYRGVFGSHMANVMRRLQRLCEFYGAHPQFICCSATIANPKELAERITGVDKNGAPQGEKHFIFYNPPVVNEQLGIRASSLQESKKIAADLLVNGISTIVFSRARVTMEVLVSALKSAVQDALGNSDLVRGYRGGYLPSERRAIEKGLREGSVRGVVSTNALELGIDIGSLEACVLNGYPGTIASTWQQSGRAGRRQGVAATVFVANSSPLNQFMMKHPEYFLNQPPENGLVNPDNLYILLSHVKCAAFELPFKDGDTYGGREIAEVLKFLEEAGVLHHVGGLWHWSAEEFPASEVSLRSASNENFIIVDTTGGETHVLGEMDRFAAPMLLHDEAIYMHEGQQFQVDKLDFPNKKVFVRSVSVDYYTDADLAVNLRVLDCFKAVEDRLSSRSHGEALVSSLVTMFKKMHLETGESVGWGKVHLPELEMHTTAYWMTFEEELLRRAGADAAEGLMCDPKDISVFPQAKSPYTNKPTIFIYDTIPGGMGLSEKLFDLHAEILSQCLKMVQECPCPAGCPSCVGPDGVNKRVVIKLLEEICGEY
jgi:DEAD/DEAH box helicase domain-containing protein